MNISGIVVRSKPEDVDELVADFKKLDFCDYHFHDKSSGKIIVTVEGETVAVEIERLKKIQSIPKVISADMVMSYAKDELEKQRDMLINSPVIPDVLKKDNILAEDIIYRGDLKKKDI